VIVVAAKVCARCGETKPLSVFRRCAKSATGTQSYCRPCQDEAARERYRANKERMKRSSVEWQRANPGRMRRITLAWRLANPEKVEAHRLAKNALRRGEIVKLDACEDCGAGGLLHGHHEDYSRPLDVTWLCPGCHARRR
jgi:hypothetical protein